MTPYSNFFFFGLLLVPLAVGLVLGWLGRLTVGVQLALTAAVLLVQYSYVRTYGSVTLRQVWIVAAYAVFQLALVRGFLLVRSRWTSPAAFWTVLVLSLTPLLLAKLGPSGVESRVAFLGLSYVTFRSLDVIIGIEDRLITELPVDRFLLFLLFFPAISSGPIDRFRRFTTDLDRRRTRQDFLQDLDAGVHHIVRGFAYKFLIAALIKTHWLDVAAAGHGWLPVVSYMYAYTFYLFFDFAGYSAFAIGVGNFFGVRMPENFNRPFLAHNINDFWNRWHISLSTWFRDHVFMRFLLAATRRRWFSSRGVASTAGFFVTFGLMGLWHGIALRYVVYGLYHATLLSGHAAFGRWAKRHNFAPVRPAWRLAGTAITFQLVCIGLLIFSGRLG